MGRLLNMKVKDLIKDIENDKNKYKEIIQKIKPDSNDNARGCESFLMLALLYPVCKDNKSRFGELVDFVQSNYYTFAANVGDYIFKKNKNDKSINELKKISGFDQRNKAWIEYNENFDKVAEAWNSLDANDKKIGKEIIIDKIYKDSKEKEKEKIQYFKKDVLFKGKDVPLNLTDKLLRDCIIGKRKRIKDMFFVRNSIWDLNDYFITEARMQYSGILKAYEEYCIEKVLGEEYKLIENYANLDCEELIITLCKEIKDENIKRELISAYKDNLNKNQKGVKNIMEYFNIDAYVNNQIKQIIFTGAPGTGKTYNVLKYVKKHIESEEQYRFVQFHASYDYSDFVEGLRPVVIEGQKNNSFVRLDGIFKEFCRHIIEESSKTLNCNDKRYYFIIDEINRADLSKVFGELMYGLEESYRGSENAFDTQYKNLPTYKVNESGKAVPIENDCFKDGFYIPENLIIIGTMNDIDRSVETFDFALRRRFVWKNVKANDVMESALLEMRKDEDNEYVLKLVSSAIEMNKVINTYSDLGLNESFNIGPAYFKNGDKQTIWDIKVQPILYEYCRGRKSERVTEFINDCKKAFFDVKSDEKEKKSNAADGESSDKTN